MTGIEPAHRAWEASVLPLNYTRRICVSLYPNRFGLMVDASKEVAAFVERLRLISFMENGQYLEDNSAVLAIH